jgi:uncharacterized protein
MTLRFKDNTRHGQKRTYRRWIEETDLIKFDVVVKETDLQILAETDLSHVARESILTHRGYLEAYILQYPAFRKTLAPWPVSAPAPATVADMIVAGQKAGVGPMAAVAGAIAESVGRDLLAYSTQVIVENGGDVFIQTDREMTVGLFAGTSPLSGRIGIKIGKDAMPIAVCTSSAIIGHSLSFGSADAACILSESGALADAVATAVGNTIKASADISTAIEFAKGIDGVLGVVIIVGQKMGAWGALELVPLKGKKG